MSNLTAHTNGHDDVWSPDGRRYIEGKYPPPRTIELEGGEQLAAFGIGLVAGLLGLLGAVLSFARVSDVAEPYFGSLAPAVPLGIDLGIAAFTGLDLLMTRMHMRTRWLRLFPWGLIATTVYANIAGEPDLIGQVLHGVLPCLWIVLVEAGAHMVRVRAGLAGEGKVKRDRIPFSRWLLAPRSTVRLWRWMILWGERSYDAGLGRLQDMEIAKVRLRGQEGGPDPEMAILFKQGRLKPADVRTTLARPADASPDVPALSPANDRPKRPRGRPKGRTDEWSEDEWRTFARDLKRTLTKDGKPFSGYQLRKAARADGRTLANGKAEAIATDVLAEGDDQ
jgi:Protein of unknown function (DUF2637)